MCERCHSRATGKPDRNSGLFSRYILASCACKHNPKCQCQECIEYRDMNPHADTGWTGSRPIKNN